MTDELTAQCEHDDDIDRTWVDRGKSRRVRRKQARRPIKPKSFAGNSKRHDPENAYQDRMGRLPAKSESPATILDDWNDSEPEEQEHADDKRQLDRWSDYYRQTAALDDDAENPYELALTDFAADEQIREHAG